MTIENANISVLEMEVEIEAGPAQVWKALTENIGEWWPAEFYSGDEPGSRTFTLESTPGGRMMEMRNDGGGVLWGNVVAIEPNVRLLVLGSTFPAWGGPTQWFGTWDLAPSGQNTILKFSEHSIGRVSESGIREKDKGWGFLWSALKAHVEGAPAPEWVD